MAATLLGTAITLAIAASAASLAKTGYDLANPPEETDMFDEEALKPPPNATEAEKTAWKESRLAQKRKRAAGVGHGRSSTILTGGGDTSLGGTSPAPAPTPTAPKTLLGG